MTALSITIDGICDGLGHWTVALRDAQGVALQSVAVDWSDLQAPLDDAEQVALVRLLLRAKCAGKTLQALDALLLGGIAL